MGEIKKSLERYYKGKQEIEDGKNNFKKKLKRLLFQYLQEKVSDIEEIEVSIQGSYIYVHLPVRRVSFDILSKVDKELLKEDIKFIDVCSPNNSGLKKLSLLLKYGLSEDMDEQED